MPVIEAVRASMSIPFIFGCVKYNGLMYVDGGLLNNFLVNLPVFKEHPETVLGINLHNSQGFSVKDISTFDQYIVHIISCLYNAYINLSTTNDPFPHVVAIATSKYDVIDFMLTQSDKAFLVNLGYNKVKEHFMSPPPPRIEASTKIDAETQTTFLEER
jgi:NTE family protein